MEDMVGILIFVGIFALIGFVILFGWLAEKKRREKMAAEAESLGLEYFPDGATPATAHLGQFNLFNAGRSRKLTKLILGTTDEVQIAIFDYQYVTGGGKQSQTHRQSVTSLRSDGLMVPSFVMRPESVFSRMGSLLGFKDIDFESHPKFSKMFVLKGSMPMEIREFFTPALLEFFETQKGICMETMPGSIIFYWPGKRMRPDDLRDALAKAYEVFGLIMDHSASR